MTPTVTQILKQLIRFDTSNPPGNEASCIRYLKDLCDTAGLETQIIAKDPERPNLIARLKGNGSAPPLLLQGHVDVVTTQGQSWTQPPFEAVESEGFLWGRGALDMKSGVSMMLSSLLKLKEQNISPHADIIFCAMSDEETGSELGAKFLVNEHAEQFSKVKHALGEFGGFSNYLGNTKFYLIQVAEKLTCSLRLTIKGPAGHGSQPLKKTTMTQLAQTLQKLERKQPPIQISPTTKDMINAMSKASTGVNKIMLKLLLEPYLTDALMAASEQLYLLNPMFRNTVSATRLKGSEQINVIPAEINLDLDGRMLPGVKPEQMVQEVQAIVGQQIDISVLDHDEPAHALPDTSQFELLASTLKELDPEAVPIPYLQPGVTDGRFFSQLGIQNYGFTPLNLPKDFNFSETIHAADERVPLDALRFGAEALFRVVQRYKG